MEILYQINSINDLIKPLPDNDVLIRWLKMPDDFECFCEHLRERYPDRDFSVDDCLKWDEAGIIYCGLFKDGRMAARAAVEKYSEDKWETADVRVWQTERNKGYARQICYFVTKYILENNKTATCRTEEDNIAMQHVINALGFKFANHIQ